MYSVGDAIVLSSGRPLPPPSASFSRGEGVAFVRFCVVVRCELGELVVGSGKLSSRLVVAELRMVLRKMIFTIHVFVCYAPTFRSPRTDKDIFFNDLQAVLRSIPRHDKLVLLGDFSARVGTRSGAADLDE